jgi:LacI family transcriptional regulator
MTKRNMTIKDVAISARVSVATVSNVLNGKDRLYSAETADLVWAAVKCLDYRPNQVARSLVKNRTKTLGVVVDRTHGRLTRNAYINGLLDGFLEYANGAGYQIKLFSLVTDVGDASMSQLEDGSVDGLVLFAPPADSPLIAWAENTRSPVVFAGSAPPGIRFAAADIDDCGAAQRAVEWLIAQGHTRIGWLRDAARQWSATRREEGYRRAMQRAGLAISPTWCCVLDGATTDRVTGALAALKAAPELTAILCWNDWLALEVMQGLQNQGVRVPEDISIVGFDDIEAAQWVRPALTTVQQPMSRIGYTAAEMLIRQIRTRVPESDLVLFPGELVVRGTVVQVK